MTYGAQAAPHRISGFRVTCPRECFAPRWVEASADQSESVALARKLHSRRCKACRNPISVEAIWVDTQGRVPSGVPRDVPGARQA